MSSWVPKFSNLSFGRKPIQENAPSGDFPVVGSDKSISYDVDSVCPSNYAMSEAGGASNMDDSYDIDASYAKSEGPISSTLNGIDANSLSGIEVAELYTDPEAPYDAAKIEQQWIEYSRKHAVEEAPLKVEPRIALRKMRVILVLGVLVVASVAIGVGIMMSNASTNSATTSNGDDLAYIELTDSPAEAPVDPPSTPDNSKPAEPTVASAAAPTMTPSVPTMEPTMAPSKPEKEPVSPASDSGGGNSGGTPDEGSGSQGGNSPDQGSGSQGGDNSDQGSGGQDGGNPDGGGGNQDGGGGNQDAGGGNQDGGGGGNQDAGGGNPDEGSGNPDEGGGNPARH